MRLPLAILLSFMVTAASAADMQPAGTAAAERKAEEDAAAARVERAVGANAVQIGAAMGGDALQCGAPGRIDNADAAKAITDKAQADAETNLARLADLPAVAKDSVAALARAQSLGLDLVSQAYFTYLCEGLVEKGASPVELKPQLAIIADALGLTFPTSAEVAEGLSAQQAAAAKAEAPLPRATPEQEPPGESAPVPASQLGSPPAPKSGTAAQSEPETEKPVASAEPPTVAPQEQSSPTTVPPAAVEAPAPASEAPPAALSERVAPMAQPPSQAVAAAPETAQPPLAAPDPSPVTGGSPPPAIAPAPTDSSGANTNAAQGQAQPLSADPGSSTPSAPNQTVRQAPPPSPASETRAATPLASSAAPGSLSEEECRALGVLTSCPDLNAVLGRLLERPLEFNHPKTMSLGRKTEIGLVLRTDWAGKDLPPEIGEELKGLPGEVKQGITKITRVMSAELTGQAFEITPSNRQERTVVPPQPVSWTWQVAPTDTGPRKTLKLQLYAHMEGAAGAMPPFLVKTLDASINVDVTTWDWFVNQARMLEPAYSIGAGLLALLTLIVVFFLGRRRRIAADAGYSEMGGYFDRVTRFGGPVIGDLDQTTTDSRPAAALRAERGIAPLAGADEESEPKKD